MIKDILVNLSYGTSQDGVSNYALSVAETFGAHIVGTAFAYPEMASGVGLSVNFIRAQQAEAQERAGSGSRPMPPGPRPDPALAPGHIPPGPPPPPPSQTSSLLSSPPRSI